MSDFELTPDPERVIEGLRDTGYNFNTAIADIIDNSIAASATKIIVRINVSPELDDIVVSIADNGCGMDEEGLRNAMRYGSQRRSDPSSLGKFGLGLKTASTAFCRRLSLVSRGEKTLGVVGKVQWDLDYVAQLGRWMLKVLEPTEDDIDLLDEVAAEGHGTLVLWESVDRLLSKDYKNKKAALNNISQQREELKFHLSLVFQRFLDKTDSRAPNVEIFVDEDRLSPWDPFCTSEQNSEKTAYKKIVTRDPTNPDMAAAEFELTAWALPRPEQFSSAQAQKDAHISVDTVGFYIYRENRLIYYGDWLGMYRVDSHSVLGRVDFSFDHRLDSVFNIDIKKSRVVLADGLYSYIRDQFLPAPKRAADDKYRAGEKKKIHQTSESVHQDSNKNIEMNGPKAEQAKVLSTDPENNLVTFENTKGKFTHKIVVDDTADENQCRVIPKETLDEGVLWLPCIADQKHAVLINTSHPYYQKVYYPVRSKSVTVTGMDALLWALAEAELGTYDETVKDIYADIRIHVSYALKKLLASLPDPEVELGE